MKASECHGKAYTESWLRYHIADHIRRKRHEDVNRPPSTNYFFFFGFFFFTPPPAGPATLGVEAGVAVSLWDVSVVSACKIPATTGAGRLFCIFCISDRFSASKRLRKSDEYVLNFKHCKGPGLNTKYDRILICRSLLCYR